LGSIPSRDTRSVLAFPQLDDQNSAALIWDFLSLVELSCALGVSHAAQAQSKAAFGRIAGVRFPEESTLRNLLKYSKGNIKRTKFGFVVSSGAPVFVPLPHYTLLGKRFSVVEKIKRRMWFEEDLRTETVKHQQLMTNDGSWFFGAQIRVDKNKENWLAHGLVPDSKKSNLEIGMKIKAFEDPLPLPIFTSFCKNIIHGNRGKIICHPTNENDRDKGAQALIIATNALEVTRKKHGQRLTSSFIPLDKWNEVGGYSLFFFRHANNRATSDCHKQLDVV